MTSTTLASQWYVDDDGNADFDNIQTAVDATSDGDMIFVYPGTYTSTADEVVNMLGNGIVGVDDLLLLIAAWGPCP